MVGVALPDNEVFESVSSAEVVSPRIVRRGERLAGGKAQGLARLEAADLPVPPWFAVPAEAFEQHLERSRLSQEIASGLDALSDLPAELAAARAESVGRHLRQIIEAAPLEPALVRAIGRQLDRWPADQEFAVRSSMVGEDGGEHSYAGQLDSFLCLRGSGPIAEAVRACWASAFTARALAYRLAIGSAPREIRMAVVVQAMVPGVVSGVLFTADPGSGRRDRLLLHAVWGLGEGLVSGECECDEYLLDRGAEEVGQRISAKPWRRVRDTTSGTRLEKVPAADRERRCLTRRQTAEIGQMGIAAARALGKPLDIEWVFDGERFFLVQARPITALPEPDPGGVPPVLWDNSNIQESYCGVTTPLTFSFASRSYATVYEQTLRLIGVSEKELSERRGLLRNLLGMIRGRIYYNLNNWYRGLLLLPSFGRNKADMERMMGVDEPVDFVHDEHLTRREKIRRAPGLFWSLFLLLRAFGRLESSVPAFHARFEEVRRQVDRDRFSELGFSNLMSRWQLLWEQLVGRWETPIINDFRVMMTMGGLHRLVETSGVDQPEAVVNILLGGDRQIESTQPTHRLLQMAGVARRDPGLEALLQDPDSSSAWERIHLEHPEFGRRLDDFVDSYGDRTIGELKLETITMRQDPRLLVDMLRMYLYKPLPDFDELGRQQESARKEAEALVRGRLGPLAGRRFLRVLRHTRQAVRDRESMRLCRTRVFGLFRDLFLALGERLREAGRLHEARDVFYLTVDEIEAYHEGRSACGRLGDLVALRREELADYEPQDLPHRFETRGPVYHGNGYQPSRSRSTDPDCRTLQGIGCCPGVVEGRARVVRDPADGLDLDGEILLAVRTDPGWTPLFPAASALLVERGSTLSHSAVVARELGLPTVVGIPDLTRIVANGERLRLDGGAGTVERL